MRERREVPTHEEGQAEVHVTGAHLYTDILPEARRLADPAFPRIDGWDFVGAIVRAISPEVMMESAQGAHVRSWEARVTLEYQRPVPD